MLCAVYKSIRKPQTYIFVAKRDDFSQVPTPLLEQFGPPQLVSILNIKETTKMAIAEASRVIKEVTDSGFYLQLPPPPIDYLKDHKNRKLQQLESES
ncbi:YcgL domain-containing protein [Psychromonas arctica]|uniref:YcgL domain-containing protein V6255_03940 n=1 Tax=Psychromonas arctica TaxID=168275 RepID=A0ABU9H8T4_9GAMM|nr:YcgL domain-containing protein [uncultured Psychromonas sp.]